MLTQLCLASYFLDCGAHFARAKLRKVEVEITWCVSPWMPQLELPQLRKKMRHRDLECNGVSDKIRTTLGNPAFSVAVNSVFLSTPVSCFLPLRWL